MSKRKFRLTCIVIYYLFNNIFDAQEKMYMFKEMFMERKIATMQSENK